MQFQDSDFAMLSGARVVRIATHPDYNRVSYGGIYNSTHAYPPSSIMASRLTTDHSSSWSETGEGTRYVEDRSLLCLWQLTPRLSTSTSCCPRLEFLAGQMFCGATRRS